MAKLSVEAVQVKFGYLSVGGEVQVASVGGDGRIVSLIVRFSCRVVMYCRVMLATWISSTQISIDAPFGGPLIVRS